MAKVRSHTERKPSAKRSRDTAPELVAMNSNEEEISRRCRIAEGTRFASSVIPLQQLLASLQQSKEYTEQLEQYSAAAVRECARLVVPLPQEAIALQHWNRHTSARAFFGWRATAKLRRTGLTLCCFTVWSRTSQWRRDLRSPIPRPAKVHRRFIQAARVALACGGFLGLDLCLINSTVADARRGCLRMLVQKIMGMCERHRCKIVLRCWKRWCRICVGVQVQEAKRRWRILSKVSAGWRMYCEYIHRVREFTIARRSRKEVSISQNVLRAWRFSVQVLRSGLQTLQRTREYHIRKRVLGSWRLQVLATGFYSIMGPNRLKRCARLLWLMWRERVQKQRGLRLISDTVRARRRFRLLGKGMSIMRRARLVNVVDWSFNMCWKRLAMSFWKDGTALCQVHRDNMFKADVFWRGRASRHIQQRHLKIWKHRVSQRNEHTLRMARIEYFSIHRRKVLALARCVRVWKRKATLFRTSRFALACQKRKCWMHWVRVYESERVRRAKLEMAHLLCVKRLRNRVQVLLQRWRKMYAGLRGRIEETSDSSTARRGRWQARKAWQPQPVSRTSDDGANAQYKIVPSDWTDDGEEEEDEPAWAELVTALRGVKKGGAPASPTNSQTNREDGKHNREHLPEPSQHRQWSSSAVHMSAFGGSETVLDRSSFESHDGQDHSQVEAGSVVKPCGERGRKASTSMSESDPNDRIPNSHSDLPQAEGVREKLSPMRLGAHLQKENDPFNEFADLVELSSKRWGDPKMRRGQETSTHSAPSEKLKEDVDDAGDRYVSRIPIVQPSLSVGENLMQQVLEAVGEDVLSALHLDS